MKVFYFSTIAMAQLNYDNFSPFVGNSYAYDDAEMFEGFGSAATVDPQFYNYEENYSNYFDSAFGDSASGDNTDEMFEINAIEKTTTTTTTTTTSTTTTTTTTTTEVPTTTEILTTSALTSIAAEQNEIEKVEFKRNPFTPSVRSGVHTDCMECHGQDMASCRTNSPTTCAGENDVCLVTLRSRAGISNPLINSRCAPLSTCLDHEAQNFVGVVPQCRSNHSARFNRGSVCSFCHKLGNLSTMFLLGSNEIETDATTVTLAAALADPQRYFSSSGANYIYASQTWN